MEFELAQCIQSKNQSNHQFCTIQIGLLIQNLVYILSYGQSLFQGAVPFLSLPFSSRYPGVAHLGCQSNNNVSSSDSTQLFGKLLKAKKNTKIGKLSTVSLGELLHLLPETPEEPAQHAAQS